jgi:hypothetical protein
MPAIAKPEGCAPPSRDFLREAASSCSNAQTEALFLAVWSAGGLGFQSMELTVTANGVELLESTFRSLAVAESFFRDRVIDLGSDLGGPGIDLTIAYNLVADGSGGFGFDFAAPEPSTWARRSPVSPASAGSRGCAGARPRPPDARWRQEQRAVRQPRCWTPAKAGVPVRSVRTLDSRLRGNDTAPIPSESVLLLSRRHGVFHVSNAHYWD